MFNFNYSQRVQGGHGGLPPYLPAGAECWHATRAALKFAQQIVCHFPTENRHAKRLRRLSTLLWFKH